MITVLLFIVIGILIAIKAIHRSHGEIWEYFLGGLVGIIGGLIIGFLLSIIIGAFLPKHTVVSETIPIAAFSDHTSVHGKFFLGSGVIDENMYYFYYKQNPNGSYSFNKLETDCVEIIEDSGVQPHIIKYRKKFDSKNGILFGFVPLSGTRACGCVCKIEIIVPNNTIYRNFNLDLK